MKKYEWIISIINFVLLIVLIFLTFTICESEEKIIIGEINNKFEVNDKCYVEINVEVTPGEYIGYDIGDDYILNIKPGGNTWSK